MSDTYSDVDASADPGGAAEWQERMSRWPAIQAYKARSCELLADAGRLLDVGCGPGIDALTLGPGRCVGVDRSSAMLGAARGRGVAVCRSDAHRLPFADGTFTGVRADRVVQHLSEPERALREIVRVTATGGRIVIADPDQESLVIQMPGVRARVLDQLKALRRDLGYRNGRLISRLPGLLAGLGVRTVTVEAFPLLLTDPAEAFGLPGWVTLWRAQGGFTDEEVREWEQALERPAENGFLYMITFVVVAGCKR